TERNMVRRRYRAVLDRRVPEIQHAKPVAEDRFLALVEAILDRHGPELARDGGRAARAAIVVPAARPNRGEPAESAQRAGELPEIAQACIKGIERFAYGDRVLPILARHRIRRLTREAEHSDGGQLPFELSNAGGNEERPV